MKIVLILACLLTSAACIPSETGKTIVHKSPGILKVTIITSPGQGVDYIKDDNIGRCTTIYSGSEQAIDTPCDKLKHIFSRAEQAKP